MIMLAYITCTLMCSSSSGGYYFCCFFLRDSSCVPIQRLKCQMVFPILNYWTTPLKFTNCFDTFSDRLYVFNWISDIYKALSNYHLKFKVMPNFRCRYWKNFRESNNTDQTLLNTVLFISWGCCIRGGARAIFPLVFDLFWINSCKKCMILIM